MKPVDKIELQKGDCFGRLYSPEAEECRICHDDSLCMINWQQQHKLDDKTITMDEVPIEKICKMAVGCTYLDVFEAVKSYAKNVDPITVDLWLNKQLEAKKLKVYEGIITKE